MSPHTKADSPRQWLPFMSPFMAAIDADPDVNPDAICSGEWIDRLSTMLQEHNMVIDWDRHNKWANSAHPSGMGPVCLLTGGLCIDEGDDGLYYLMPFVEPKETP